MNSTLVQLHIFPAGIDLNRLNEYDPDKYGKVFSDINTIKVNKVRDGYSVLYRDDIFDQLDIDIFGKNVMYLFMSNIQQLNIEMEIGYYPMDRFNPDTAISIIHLNNYLTEIQIPRFTYCISNFIDELIEMYDEEEDCLIIESNKNDDDDEYDDDDPISFLRGSLGDYNSPKQKKNKKKSYASSRVVKSANNPKRDIRRHGVIVCNDKDIIKKDERIIKDFLNDFIQGNSEWKKEFRKSVLKRWIQMYVITKKNLKYLEKEHRRKKPSKNILNRFDKSTAANITRRLFTPVDSWNDPNR